MEMSPCGGLQNLGLRLVFIAFELGGVFIGPHLLWHGTSGFEVSSKGSPNFVAFYNREGVLTTEDLKHPNNTYSFAKCMIQKWKGKSRLPYRNQILILKNHVLADSNPSMLFLTSPPPKKEE